MANNTLVLKGHLGTWGTRALEGHLSTWALRHSGTRGTRGTLFSRLKQNLLKIKSLNFNANETKTEQFNSIYEWKGIFRFYQGSYEETNIPLTKKMWYNLFDMKQSMKSYSSLYIKQFLS